MLTRSELKRTVRTWLGEVGLTDYRWRKLPPGLYVFNYHRVGDASQTQFDPNVFSCDEEHFTRQVDLLRSRFEIISLSTLVDLLERDAPVREPLAMLTFDDGYRDNYSNAFPILKASNTPAVFFLPTSYVGGVEVPWWDEIAWMLRNTTHSHIEIPPWCERITISDSIAEPIRHVLAAFKASSLPLDTKLQHVRAATGCTLEAHHGEGLFMSWDEARALQQAGMDIGSHTCSHRILAHLPAAEQREEMARSKAVLEQQLGHPISALSYPVGTPGTYTQQSQQLARECGYRAAFSFVSGVNGHLTANRFCLRRFPVGMNAEPSDLQFSLAFRAGNRLGSWLRSRAPSY